ncbi:MAG TPA: hypothetical protein VGC41_07390, partial [Kofleriaceae bacterium]
SALAAGRERFEWQLERVHALELGDQLVEACRAIADLLDEDPDDRRLSAAVLRIATRAKDDLMTAAAAAALARTSKRRETALRLFRQAAELYERTRMLRNAAACYARIIALEPDAPEARRASELQLELGDWSGAIRSLGSGIAATRDQTQKLERLYRRAAAFHELGHRDQALADLDAILAVHRSHADALLLRATLLGGAVVDAVTSEHSVGEDTLDTWDPEITRSDAIEVSIIVERERREAQSFDAIESDSRSDLSHDSVTRPDQARAPTLKLPVIRPKDWTQPALVVPAFDDTILGPAAAPPELPRLDPRAFVVVAPKPMSPDDSEVVVMSMDELSATPRVSLQLEYDDLEGELGTASTRIDELQCEAARLAWKLGDRAKTRLHYELALAANPRATTAMRGLRRLARATADPVLLARWLEPDGTPAEIAGIQRMRADLFLTTGDLERARIAISALPEDVARRLLELELELRGGTRAGIDAAAARLASVQGDPIITGFVEAVRAEPAIAVADGAALFELSCAVEGADPETATALALVAEPLLSGEARAAAIALAIRAMPRDPFVAARVAEAAKAAGDVAVASHAYARLARAGAPDHRADAAGFAAELAPDHRLARLWKTVVELEPENQYARFRANQAAPQIISSEKSDVVDAAELKARVLAACPARPEREDDPRAAILAILANPESAVKIMETLASRRSADSLRLRAAALALETENPSTARRLLDGCEPSVLTRALRAAMNQLPERRTPVEPFAFCAMRDVQGPGREADLLALRERDLARADDPPFALDALILAMRANRPLEARRAFEHDPSSRLAMAVMDAETAHPMRGPF